jgi:hypothetical protein
MNKSNYITSIYNNLINITNYNELFKYKTRLEINPFCGIQTCYDLEQLIFYEFNTTQRDTILKHIAQLAVNRPKKYHIFTTFDYYNSSPSHIKKFLTTNYHYITILSNFNEKYEVYYRSINKPISIISDINIKTRYKSLKSSNTIISEMTILSIENYLKIFPEFVPIYIDKYNDISKLVSEVIEISLLEGLDFKDSSEFFKIFNKLLEDTTK